MAKKRKKLKTRSTTVKKPVASALNEKWLPSIFQAIHDLILICDSEGKILSSNHSTHSFLGYSSEEVLGFEIFNFFTAPHAEILRSECRSEANYVNSSKPMAPRRLLCQHKNGTLSPVSVAVSKTEIQRKSRMIFVIRDIIQVLHAEHELERESLELSKSNRDLQRFSAVVAHDLLAPLRTIIAFGEDVAKNSQSQLTPENQLKLKRINQAALRMRQLLMNLLTLSRARHAPLANAVVDMNALFDEVHEDLMASIQESKARVSREQLPKICGDREQLRQLLQNLLTNALKFRHPERTPEIRLHAKLENPDAIFCLSDNGIGIEPQNFQKIFETFQKLHSEQEYPGSGLGLAICQRIVERHKGKLWLQSTPGSGSSFFFRISSKTNERP